MAKILDPALQSEKDENSEYGIWHFFLRSLSLLRPYSITTAIIFFAILLSVIISVLMPILYEEMFNQAIPNKDINYLLVLFALSGAAFLVSFLLDLLWEGLVAKLSSLILRDIRLQMFKSLEIFSLDYFERVSTGDTMSRFSNDLLAIENYFAITFARTIYGLLIFLFSMLLMFWVNWQLAVISIITLPLALIGSMVFGRKANTASYERKENEAKLSIYLEEVITSQPIIRAYTLQKFIFGQFMQLLTSLQKKTFKLSLFTCIIETFTLAGLQLALIIVMGSGAYLTLKGSITIGSLIAFFTILVNVVTGISLIGLVISEAFKAMGGMQRIDQLICEKSHAIDGDAKSLESLENEICFKNVSFSYDKVRQNIATINLKIPKGLSVAFVGPSGSGKSTILKLILRFYDPDKGDITWDGQDLRAVHMESLRKYMSVVFQDTSLFNTTIRENIRLGKLDATNDDIEEAAKASEIHDFITKLPQGYDTIVGEHGGRLSGGQRQRIAIARAIVRQPDILVLDEATSALDIETEHFINQTLQQLRKNRSVICVTHRLSFIEDFDIIFVLKNGRVFESGNHESLMANKNLYYKMVQKQSGIIVNAATRDVKVKASYLKTIPLLSAIQEDILETMSHYFVTEWFSENQIIFRQGELGQKFYLIAHGNVEVSRDHTIVARLGIGDYFGEIALIKNIPRTATIKTLTPCIFINTTRDIFQTLLKDHPRLLEKIQQEAEIRIALNKQIRPNSL